MLSVELQILKYKYKKEDNKRQDIIPAGVVEQILPATFALTFSASLAQNLIELYLASGMMLT